MTRIWLAVASALIAWAPAAHAQQHVLGELTATDAKLSGSEYFDAYEIPARSGERLAITLRSAAFDTYLILISPFGKYADNDDHAASTSVSRIESDVRESGKWLILVTSADAGELGAYELQLNSAAKVTALSAERVRAYAAAWRFNEIADSLGSTAEGVRNYKFAYDALLKADRPEEGLTLLIRIAGEHRSLGQPDSALHYGRRSVLLARQFGDRYRESLALHNVGAAHADKGQADSAAGYYAQTLAIERALNDLEGQTFSLVAIGNHHLHVGRPDSARAYYDQALRIAQDARLPEREIAALKSLAYAFRFNMHFDSARVYDNAALELARKLGADAAAPVLRAEEARTLAQIGREFASQGQADSALIYLRRSLAIRRETGDRLGEAFSLENIAYLYSTLLRDPARAVAYDDSTWSALSALRARAGSDTDRISFSEQFRSISRALAKSWRQRAGEIGERQSMVASLAAIERGRAQALLDLMRGTQEVSAGSDYIAAGDSLLAGLRARNTALLSYVVARDTLFAWLALPSGALRLHSTAIADTALTRQIAELRRALRVDSATVRNVGDDLERNDGAPPVGPLAAGGYATRLSALADLLLPAQLLAELPPHSDLAVIPDGPLSLVPFAALPIGSDNALGLQYRLRYGPSIAALLEAESRAGALSTAERSGKDALVVGNPAMPEVTTATGEKRRLNSLPGAEREGRAVAQRLGTQMLAGAAATESRVLEQLGSARLIHMATHGYAYSTEARARDSFVALAPGGGRDGLLTVGEVLDHATSLQADLVVLSACQTGLGDQKQAEGTVGLQRAFLAKGARSVLVSLWSVSDEVTDMLMQRFYAHWLDGDSKPEALRKAQEEVRELHPNPRYWAAFQLVGAR